MSSSSASPSTTCRDTPSGSRAASAASRPSAGTTGACACSICTSAACAARAMLAAVERCGDDEQEPAEQEQQEVAADDQRRSPCPSRSSCPCIMRPPSCRSTAGATGAAARSAGAPLTAAVMLNWTPLAGAALEPDEPSRTGAGARERDVREIGDEREARKQPRDAVVRERRARDHEALRGRAAGRCSRASTTCSEPSS